MRKTAEHQLKPAGAGEGYSGNLASTVNVSGSQIKQAFSKTANNKMKQKKAEPPGEQQMLFSTF